MELCEFQKIDPSNGLIYPWLTHPALDEIGKWDMSDKIIWQWGSGLGDLWLAKKGAVLHSVERNSEWYNKCYERAVEARASIIFYPRFVNEGSGHEQEYTFIPEWIRPDIFIVDDAYRYECILKAIEHKPCTLIIDNWQQDYVFICPAAEEALKDYEGQLYVQPDHQNHEGRPWTTAIFHLK